MLTIAVIGLYLCVGTAIVPSLYQIEMRKTRKPRTKPQPWYYQGECMYFDGISYDGKPIHECFEPWNSQCMDGDIHKCLKLRLKWLASLSPEKRRTEIKRLEQWN